MIGYYATAGCKKANTVIIPHEAPESKALKDTDMSCMICKVLKFVIQFMLLFFCILYMRIDELCSRFYRLADLPPEERGASASSWRCFENGFPAASKRSGKALNGEKRLSKRLKPNSMIWMFKSDGILGRLWLANG